METPTQRPQIVSPGARRSRHARARIGRIVLLAAALGAAALAVLLVLWFAPGQGAGAQRARELAEENGALVRALAVARRTRQVTAEANDQLRRELFAAEQALARLETDLAFYQRLLGGADTRRGLDVHDLALAATGSPRVYRFRLTLSQDVEQAQRVEGAFQLAAEGVLDDRMVELDGDALAVRVPEDDGRFRFKYFQELDGSLNLPDGFHPERLLVRLYVDGRDDDPVLRRFEWAELFGDAASRGTGSASSLPPGEGS